jgi:hypothetical protein
MVSLTCAKTNTKPFYIAKLYGFSTKNVLKGKVCYLVLMKKVGVWSIGACV